MGAVAPITSKTDRTAVGKLEIWQTVACWENQTYQDICKFIRLV